MAELADCRRTGTVADYQDRFQALLARAGPLEEAQSVQLFTGGLLPPLSIDPDPEPANPGGRDEPGPAVRVVGTVHRASTQCRAQTSPVGASPSPSTASAASTAGSKAGPPRRRPPHQAPHPGRTGGATSPRLCYNCDENFTRGHNRIYKRLFLLEGIEDDDDAALQEHTEAAEQEEVPMFSLQALAGVTFTGTASLVALLDSDSTNNFISEASAHHSGLPIHRHTRLTAMVANSECVKCLGVIRSALLSIGGDSFSADVTPGLQKDINRAIIYMLGSSHAYIQQNKQYITAHIT